MIIIQYLEKIIGDFIQIERYYFFSIFTARIKERERKKYIL